MEERGSVYPATNEDVSVWYSGLPGVGDRRPNAGKVRPPEQRWHELELRTVVQVLCIVQM